MLQPSHQTPLHKNNVVGATSPGKELSPQIVILQYELRGEGWNVTKPFVKICLWAPPPPLFLCGSSILFTKHFLFHIPVHCFPFSLRIQMPTHFSVVRVDIYTSLSLSLGSMSMTSLYISNHTWYFSPVDLSHVNLIFKSKNHQRQRKFLPLQQHTSRDNFAVLYSQDFIQVFDGLV